MGNYVIVHTRTQEVPDAVLENLAGYGFAGFRCAPLVGVFEPVEMDDGSGFVEALWRLCGFDLMADGEAELSSGQRAVLGRVCAANGNAVEGLEP